jgi:DNA-binding CsgD family transcriptional regulator
VREHVLGLVAANWGLGADVLTDIFAPDASAGTRAALSAYQREASSPETAAALLRLCHQVDVTACLGQVRAPTLVVHRDEDRAAPLDQSRLIAARVPGARLEVLPGRSHLPYAGDTALLVATIRSFLGLPVGRASAGPSLTGRQREVAALVADGLTNREIGERLGIEERSAEGHLERIRLRLGVRSRAQVAAWWVATRADRGGYPPLPGS